MHYTALVGTLYYPGVSDSGPSNPLLGTSALIGIIASIVVVSCIILFLIGARASIQSHPSLFQSKKSHKRLILDTIFFDTSGRIMVKVDGVVPMKEILNEIPQDVQYIKPGVTKDTHELLRKRTKPSLQATHFSFDCLKPRFNGLNREIAATKFITPILIIKHQAILAILQMNAF